MIGTHVLIPPIVNRVFIPSVNKSKSDLLYSQRNKCSRNILSFYLVVYLCFQGAESIMKFHVH